MYELRVQEFKKRLDQLLDVYTEKCQRWIKIGAMIYIDNKIQCTREILDILPSHPIFCKCTLSNMQRDNPFLTLDYVLEHNHIEWSWSLLSRNPSVATPANLDKYPDIPWCFMGISCHIPFDYYLAHPEKCWDNTNLISNSRIPIEFLVITILNTRPLPVIASTFKHRSAWVPDMLRKFRNDPINWYIVPYCDGYFDKCDLHDLHGNMDLDIPVRFLSNNPNITKEFVMEYIHKPWVVDTMRKEILDRELALAFLHAGKVRDYLVIMAQLVNSHELDEFIDEWYDVMSTRIWSILSRSANIRHKDIIARKRLPWNLPAVAERRDAMEDQIPPNLLTEYNTHQLLYAIQDVKWHDAMQIASGSRHYLNHIGYTLLKRKLMDFEEWDARLHMAAYKIQKWWLKRYYDPTHLICKKRLMHEFKSLSCARGLARGLV